MACVWIVWNSVNPLLVFCLPCLGFSNNKTLSIPPNPLQLPVVVSRACLESTSIGFSGFPSLLPSAIASILRAWLDQCAEDFREPPHFPCLQKLLEYLKQKMPGSDPERRAQNLLEQFQKQDVDSDSEYLFGRRETATGTPQCVCGSFIDSIRNPGNLRKLGWV